MLGGPAGPGPLNRGGRRPITRQMARPAASAAPPVIWRGDAEEQHSLAVVNAGITRALAAAGHEVHLLAPGDAALALPAVGVAQQWPPRFEPPSDGPFVLYQPWEFGRVPAAWVERIRAGVDEVWTLSHSVRDAFVRSGVPLERVHVVPAGVDLDRFTPAGPRRPLPTTKGTVLLFVGGALRRKGVDLLLEAYGRAFDAADDVCLVVKAFGGKGVYQGLTLDDEIAAFRARPGAPELVLLDDDVPYDELPALYRAVDAVVQPYRAEGFCLPALEALACGRPVVVPSGGPTDDFVTERCAWLLPVRTAPVREDAFAAEELRLAEPGFTLEPDLPALAAALREAADPEARAAKAAMARGHAERFSWEHAGRAAAARLRALAGRTPIRAGVAPNGASGHDRVELILRRAAEAALAGPAAGIREGFA
ncbi:MAG: hypothetical protein QOD86_1906, partial [Miltoncostaeaceae bacterium]|nr:hypothetical protein [Miltoncostaeaceae bacterium]